MNTATPFTRPYAGLPKPGHSVFDGAMATTASSSTVVRSRFFSRYLGTEVVSVPSAGVTPVGPLLVPRPVGILTDLLQHQPHAPGGLVSEGAGEPAWVEATRLLLSALEQQGILTVLPADQHLNPDLLNRHATTSFELVEPLLFPAERARLRQHPDLAARLAAGGPMTLADYETLFGAVVDKEDRNFLPHCREGVVEYIPSVTALLARQRARVKQQLDAGHPAPTATVLPDFKTGLSCLSAPDARGLHGNALRDILLASQRGLYLDGAARAHHKLALVGGTAHEYSVAELIRFLVDMDYSVVWMLTCTGGLGIGAKLATALELMERYGSRLFCTHGWPLAEHLGPMPAAFQKLSARVEQEDLQELDTFETSRRTQVQQRVTSQGKPILVTAQAIQQARSHGDAMSTVDRRPTVARNLLGGDRRSVEAALEHWMAARPAVTRIILEGDGASVAATALGLWDVARMRGGVLPCQVVARVAATPITYSRPSDAMAAACGASTRGMDTAQPQDVLLVVHPACLPAKTQARLARVPCPTVLVLTPGAVVPKAWRAHPAMVAIPTTVDSLTLDAIVEAVLEDLAPHHILLAGGGPALFGAAVASGDFLLERQGEVPTPAKATALLREQVVLLEDALTLPPFKTAMDVWRDTCARAGALLESVPAGTVQGVVMVPEQGAALAA